MEKFKKDKQNKLKKKKNKKYLNVILRRLAWGEHVMAGSSGTIRT